MLLHEVPGICYKGLYEVDPLSAWDMVCLVWTLRPMPDTTRRGTGPMTLPVIFEANAFQSLLDALRQRGYQVSGPYHPRWCYCV